MNTKIEKAKRLLVASGGAAAGDVIIDGILDALRPAANVPEIWFAEIRRNCSAADLVEQVASLYAAAISEEDLDALLAFFESPAGTRYAAAVPRLTEESMAISQQWGAAMGAKIAGDLERRLDSEIADLERRAAGHAGAAS